jgi:hypothetical protein
MLIGQQQYYLEDGWGFTVIVAEGRGGEAGNQYPVFMNEDGSIRILSWKDDENMVRDEYNIEHPFCMTQAQNDEYQGQYKAHKERLQREQEGGGHDDSGDSDSGGDGDE